MATTVVTPGRLEAGSEIKVNTDDGEQIAKIAGRYEPYSAEGYDAATIEAGVASGDIIKDENTIVRVEKEYVVYTQFLAVTLDGARALLPVNSPDALVLEDGKPKKGAPSIASKFNYGNDLDAKRIVRNMHESTKPASLDKTINKAVAALVALGYSETDAKALAVAQAPAA